MAPGQAPNQLLDQQESLISQLSQDVNVNTVTQSDGSTSVFIGNGQPLVVGGNSSTVTTTSDQFNSGQPQLALQTSSGTVNITSAISGGTLGGLLQFQEQMLTPGRECARPGRGDVELAREPAEPGGPGSQR